MVAEIAQALSAIKTFSDLTTLAQKLKVEAAVRDKAIEAQTAIISLQSAMLGFQAQYAEMQDVVREKDERIKELEAAFHIKDKLVRSGDAYYVVGDDNKPTGAPYCSHCWEVAHKTIHLHQGCVPFREWTCSLCNSKFQKNAILNLPDKKTK